MHLKNLDHVRISGHSAYQAYQAYQSGHPTTAVKFWSKSLIHEENDTFCSRVFPEQTGSSQEDQLTPEFISARLCVTDFGVPRASAPIISEHTLLRILASRSSPDFSTTKARTKEHEYAQHDPQPWISQHKNESQRPVMLVRGER